MLRLPPKLIQAPGLRPGVPSSSSDSWRHSNHPGRQGVPDWQVRNGQPKGAVDQRFLGGLHQQKLWIFSSMRIWQDLTQQWRFSRAKRGWRTNANQLSTMSGLHSLKFCGVTLEIPNKNLEVLRGIFQPCLITRGFPGPCHFFSHRRRSYQRVFASFYSSPPRLGKDPAPVILSTSQEVRSWWNLEPKATELGGFPRLGSVRNWKILRFSWWMDVDGFSCTDIEKRYHMFDM